MDTLRVDEKRKINSHGKPRSAGKGKGRTSVVQVQPHNQGLVHRNEEVQVNALKDWYSDAQRNEKHLNIGIFIGQKLIPGIIALFVTVFWYIGMMHYNKE